MSTYAERLKTFVEWPNKTPGAEELARAGFRYTGSDDQVTCPSCNGKLKNWESHDVPFDEHKQNFPKCKFVCEVAQASEKTERSCKDILSCDEVKCCQLVGGKTETDADCPKRPTTEELKHVPTLEDMDLNNLGQRRATFRKWPTGKPTAERMIDAGFCYTGYRDVVKCYVCKGYLHNWEARDDPMLEHETYYKKSCSLVNNKAEDLKDVEKEVKLRI